MPLLLLLSIAAFVSALTIRMIDPLVPAIARGFVLPVETAAMLATAYTFPYALAQPVLGPLGDAIGKAKVIKACLLLLALALATGAMVTDFRLLMASRIVAGIAGGGIIPIAFAIIGDRFPPQERQIALSRLVMSSQLAILLGSVAGGIVAAEYSWRWMFAFPAAIALAVFVLMLAALKPRAGAVRRPVSIAKARQGYAEVLASPLACVCLVGVFVEGIAMLGLTPFIASRLEHRGLGGLREAGIVIGALSIGGIAFTLAVRQLLTLLGRPRLIRLGGVITAAGLLAVAFSPSWTVEALAFLVVGAGFFMMHNSLQALSVELAPDARASGVATFAFAFFSGQALGPVLYGIAFARLGDTAPVIAGAAMLLALAVWAAARLELLAAKQPASG
jgi:predicted MFS family arabinose efflux permease